MGLSKPAAGRSSLPRPARAILAVGDLLAFQTFLRLCAGRVGQLVNFSALAADAGVPHNTARACCRSSASEHQP